jgi:transcriptional regulator with XRE-family HTH domain
MNRATSIKFPGGSLIRAARESRALTREELAVRVGCSAPALGNNERGAHEPHERVLFRIARELDLNVDELRRHA